MVLAIATTMVLSAAPPAVEHGGAWIVLNAQPKVSSRTRGLSIWGEHQTRLWRETQQFVTRPGLGYRFKSIVSLWAGYDWIATFPAEGVRHEQRAWQQVIVAAPGVEPVGVLLRLRVEERKLADVDGWPVRLRHLVRLRVGVAPRVGLLGWDELFWHAVGTDGGPDTGLDHNRGFAGVGIDLADGITTEIGYLNHRALTGGNQATHFGAVFVMFTPAGFE